MADDWRTPETEALVDAILRLDDRDDAERFLRDLCTLGRAPRHGPALGGRPAARRRAALRGHLTPTGASTATITRIASWLNHGEGGYREMLDRLKETGDGRLPYPLGPER